MEPYSEGDRPKCALVVAAAENNVDELRKLITMRSDVNEVMYGTGALVWAARAGATAAVRLLVEAGAETRTVGRSGRSALEWAEMKEHHEVASVLKEAQRGLPPLPSAAPIHLTTQPQPPRPRRMSPSKERTASPPSARTGASAAGPQDSNTNPNTIVQAAATAARLRAAGRHEQAEQLEAMILEACSEVGAPNPMKEGDSQVRGSTPPPRQQLHPSGGEGSRPAKHEPHYPPGYEGKAEAAQDESTMAPEESQYWSTHHGPVASSSGGNMGRGGSAAAARPRGTVAQRMRQMAGGAQLDALTEAAQREEEASLGRLGTPRELQQGGSFVEVAVDAERHAVYGDVERHAVHSVVEDENTSAGRMPRSTVADSATSAGRPTRAPVDEANASTGPRVVRGTVAQRMRQMAGGQQLEALTQAAQREEGASHSRLGRGGSDTMEERQQEREQQEEHYRVVMAIKELRQQMRRRHVLALDLLRRGDADGSDRLTFGEFSNAVKSLGLAVKATPTATRSTPTLTLITTLP